MDPPELKELEDLAEIEALERELELRARYLRVIEDRQNKLDASLTHKLLEKIQNKENHELRRIAVGLDQFIKDKKEGVPSRCGEFCKWFTGLFGVEYKKEGRRTKRTKSAARTKRKRMSKRR